jgi:hypothetical protein
MKTEFILNDGGRSKYFGKKKAGDCVARSIAIVANLDYKEVHDYLSKQTGLQRASSRSRKREATADKGINTKRKWFQDYMKSLGFQWHSTMQVGEGCKVHLNANELPSGRLIVCVSKHYTAMIEGVLHDTFNPQRFDPVTGDCSRCVYGYWKLK